MSSMAVRLVRVLRDDIRPSLRTRPAATDRIAKHAGRNGACRNASPRIMRSTRRGRCERPSRRRRISDTARSRRRAIVPGARASLRRADGCAIQGKQVEARARFGMTAHRLRRSRAVRVVLPSGQGPSEPYGNAALSDDRETRELDASVKFEAAHDDRSDDSHAALAAGRLDSRPAREHVSSRLGRDLFPSTTSPRFRRAA